MSPPPHWDQAGLPAAILIDWTLTELNSFPSGVLSVGPLTCSKHWPLALQLLILLVSSPLALLPLFVTTDRFSPITGLTCHRAALIGVDSESW